MAMPTVGPSVDVANDWLNTFSNIPAVYSLACAQLYTNFPGADGLSNQFVVTARQALQFSLAADAEINLQGTPPIWIISGITVPTDIRYIGMWSGFDGDPGAKFLFPGILVPSRTVAAGDTFSLATCKVKMVGLAAA